MEVTFGVWHEEVCDSDALVCLSVVIQEEM